MLVGLLLVGCQEPPTASAPSATPVAPSLTAFAGPPGNTAATLVALVREGQAVTVGMLPDEAFKIFRDPGDGGFEDTRLPPRLASPYRSRSWESATEGFGVVTFEGRVVVAMAHEERASLGRAMTVVEMYRSRFNRPADVIVNGRTVNYWFWEQDAQRVMVMSFRPKAGEASVQVTTAMGTTGLLDVLGMSPIKAKADAPVIDKALAIRETSPTPTRS